ncbi:methylated-DNA--[protein]-cysteine S-methyltransferase [Alkalihalobacillus sp. AL-G]|uniref:methylated-DNA--[protein]-cysteine S-methyltransferase n=1 Tax=Alkalihalobacillus sp. AL-G TaxID=2926399 RepID=UPI00272C97B7|nr:methylated-DNA--[protein]-cysteine S-methyltransferase [Alkalihalobacillus sp. AL-G]WLD92831.1 methylated-DNA--[protein]-cysteine S-methyltransferase [Alkalihalobacillus sp. AL-G]
MMAMPKVYWTEFTHPFFQNQPLYLAATNKGLCRITWPSESMDTLKSWVKKQVLDAELIEDEERLSEYVSQLRDYCDGKRNTFNLPLDMRGTSFQTSVWRALTDIPFGETRSYSDVADGLDNPKAVRAVGTANGANPIPIVIPCHRVIGKSSALTGFRGGLNVKESLLQLEGYHDYTKKGHVRFQF